METIDAILCRVDGSLHQCLRSRVGGKRVHRLLFFVRLERVEGLLHQFSAQFFFIRRREFGVAGHVHDSGS